MRVAVIICLALSLAACGVKSQLTKPGPKPVQAQERDPSQPPQPLGK